MHQAGGYFARTTIDPPERVEKVVVVVAKPRNMMAAHVTLAACDVQAGTTTAAGAGPCTA